MAPRWGPQLQVDDSVRVTFEEYDTPAGKTARRRGYTGVVVAVQPAVVVVLDDDGSTHQLSQRTLCQRLCSTL